MLPVRLKALDPAQAEQEEETIGLRKHDSAITTVDLTYCIISE